MSLQQIYNRMENTPARARRDATLRAVFFIIGFAPITALSLALFGFLPLHLSAPVVWGPALLAAIILGVRYPLYGKLAFKGLILGMVATFVYDATRWPWTFFGLWIDFIPKIGGLVLHNDTPNCCVGYLYRYLGDGGGMGVAFMMIYPWVKKTIDVRKGAIAYGVVVWLCLMATLAGCPAPEKLMFALSPLSFIMSLVGHLVYGGLLGLQLKRWEDSRAMRRAETVAFFGGRGISPA